MAQFLEEYDFRAGDTLSTLKRRCRNKQDGSVIPLTGHTVDLLWGANVQLMAIIDANAGVVGYQFTAGELVVGDMDFRMRITETATGFVVHSTATFRVRVGP